MDNLPAEIDEDDDNRAILDHNLMPECMRDDRYFVMNETFVRQKQEIIEDIVRQRQAIPVWQQRAAKLFFQGKDLKYISDTCTKKPAQIKKFLDSLPAKMLVSAYQTLELIDDGPNDLQRKMTLWRVAVDNELSKPLVSIKAIAELNRMSEVKANKGVGGPVQIVINNAVLPAGSLDL